MNKKIELIVWDLGGVLLRINKRNVAERFIRGSGRFSSAENMIDFFVNPDQVWWDIVNRYDAGSLSDDEFFAEMSKCLQLDSNMTLDYFRDAWQSSLEFKPDMLNFVESIYKQDEVEQGIISNLSRMHHQVIFAPDKLRREWFRYTMFSFAELCIKELGDTEIFDRFIKTVGIDPAKILFIDDRLENLVSASQAGIKTFHFNRDCHHSVNLKNLILFLRSYMLTIV